MQNKTLVRLGATAAAVILSAALIGAGAAAAATPDQPSPPDTGPTLEQMDQHMRAMLPMMPPELRADADRMHEQMRPMMEQMMNSQHATMSGPGDMSTMMGGR